MELASYEVIFKEGNSRAMFVDNCPIYSRNVLNPLSWSISLSFSGLKKSQNSMSEYRSPSPFVNDPYVRAASRRSSWMHLDLTRWMSLFCGNSTT